MIEKFPNFKAKIRRLLLKKICSCMYINVECNSPQLDHMLDLWSPVSTLPEGDQKLVCVCVYTCTQYYVIMFKYTLWLDVYPQSYHIIMTMESDDHVFLWNTFSALNSACTVPLYLESNWTLTSIMTVQSHSLTSCHNADLFEKYVFFSKIMWFKLQHDMKSKRKLWKGWKEPLTWQRQTPTINGLN